MGKAAIEQVPGLKLSISEITTRSGCEDNDQKVQQVNRLVKLTCYLQSWEFVKHLNINKSHLNQGGLHQKIGEVPQYLPKTLNSVTDPMS